MSFKKVKFLDIAFENCEFAKIPVENIYNWDIIKILYIGIL